MSEGSTIEWLQRPGTKPATWNPIRARDRATGKRGWFCVHRHEGCRLCYAEAQNTRKGDSGGNGHAYKAQNEDKVEIYLDENTLMQPLHWREPRTIFVCSMSDLYGHWVKDAWLDKIKAVQALTPQHTYIELTKRPERMRVYATAMTPQRIAEAIAAIVLHPGAPYRLKPLVKNWPLPNVWGCVSCSEQKDADLYIPELLATPLAVRGVSAEPLLGPIDFTRIKLPGIVDPFDAFVGATWSRPASVGGDRFFSGAPRQRGAPHLDWVIVGGESGKDARMTHPDWVRSIDDQCAVAGVAFFFKQWGHWAPICALDDDAIERCYRPAPARYPTASRKCLVPQQVLHVDGTYWTDGTAPGAYAAGSGAMLMFGVGKKRAGRLLDGKEHNAFPEVRHG